MKKEEETIKNLKSIGILGVILSILAFGALLFWLCYAINSAASPEPSYVKGAPMFAFIYVGIPLAILTILILAESIMIIKKKFKFRKTFIFLMILFFLIFFLVFLIFAHDVWFHLTFNHNWPDNCESYFERLKINGSGEWAKDITWEEYCKWDLNAFLTQILPLIVVFITLISLLIAIKYLGFNKEVKEVFNIYNNLKST